MNKIVFITPKDARFGFALAGMDQILSDPDAIGDTLSEAVKSEQTGVIFIDERLHRHLDGDWLAGLEKRWPGLIVVLPAPEKIEEIPEDYVMDLIARAIGYQVRLKI